MVRFWIYFEDVQTTANLLLYKLKNTEIIMYTLFYSHTPSQTLLGKFNTGPVEINLWSLRFLPPTFSNSKPLPCLSIVLCTLHMLKFNISFCFSRQRLIILNHHKYQCNWTWLSEFQSVWTFQILTISKISPVACQMSVKDVKFARHYFVYFYTCLFPKINKSGLMYVS